MKRLETYLQALQAGKYEENIISGTIQKLESCSLQELSEHRLLVAAVYCQLLQYCHSMYEAEIPEQIIADLLNIFENIEQIGAEATEEEKENSNLITVWFLHELKAHRESGDVWNINDETLRDSIGILLQELDNLYFVFEIKKGGEYVFPIHEMITKVVEKPEFVNVNNPLSLYHIHILQLAVRLFTNSTDGQKIIQTLMKQCNLQFINYLHSSGEIIDTPDLLNYQKNGVMIFYNKETNRVLIRSKNKNYFSVKPLWETKEFTIEEEKDYHDNEIGFFVEYDLEKNDLLIDYSEVLKNGAGREAFLRMVFDREIYNILFEHSLIKGIDGTFHPINPFCCNDATIIKGHLKDKNGKCYDREHFLDALLRYRSSALKISNTCVMNRVSFGLAVLLLQKENTGIDALQLGKFVEDEWYQSQLLKNWAKKCKEPIEALTFITERWQKENNYCVRSLGKSKTSGEKNIEDHEIEALDFYPLKSEMDWMYLMMGCENPDKVYVLHGKVQEDDEVDFVLDIDLTYDICGKRFSQDTGQTTLTIKLGRIEDPERLLDDVWGSGEEYYFLYDNIKQKGIVYEQPLLKMLSAIERIQEKNQLTLETVSKICYTQYSEIVCMMRLQEEALCEVSKDVFCDFDSQVFYRLVHNLLWAQINKENIGSYLRVFMHHQKLDFKDIIKDEKFMRKDINTLYVPKDSRKSDSVLASIYEKHLKLKGVREPKDLYDDELEIRKDGYYHNDKYIKSIVFLCDNFEAGNATIRMLKAYLNIDISNEGETERRYVESAKARRQKYYLKKSDSANCLNALSQVPEQLIEIMLGDIIEKNLCTLEVHGYYGTETGKKAIELFLQEQGIKRSTVTYEKEIVNHASQIIDDVKRIWPKSRDNIYTVIREFNMTKGNVFPDKMLSNPKKAICMFVKKGEIIKTGI